MSISQSWIAKFAGRVLASAFVGGLVAAIVGALCVGTAGVLFGWMLDIRSTPPSWDSGFLFPGAWLGAYLGSYSGVIGALAGGVAASGGKPTTSVVPPRALLRNIALGQVFGTMGAVSSYLIFALALAQLNAQSFVGTVEDQLDLILWGAPVMTICGAIMGALWKSQARDSSVDGRSIA